MGDDDVKIQSFSISGAGLTYYEIHNTSVETDALARVESFKLMYRRKTSGWRTYDLNDEFVSKVKY